MPKSLRVSAILLLSWTVAVTLSVYAGLAQATTEIRYGEPVNMGEGTLRTYLAFDAAGLPMELGILMSHDSFDGLPANRSTTGRCFDKNGNGHIDDSGECEGDYEFALALPSRTADSSDIPFQWVGVNWQVEGHIPPGIYDLPHFDFHFYIASEESVRAIGVGACGIFIDCAHFERATQPVPAKYVDHRHVNVGAAVAAMGNHLIDSTAPEFAKPPRKFTHTMVFGAYDGRITFYEPMITREFLMSRPSTCVPIKQPNAWQTAGYYPTRYCIRYHERANKYTVSLEGLKYRKAE
jgi:hypothetical protein